jgi:purine-binding chemotaxis protein CheW
VSAETTLASQAHTSSHATVVTFQMGQQMYALPIESIVRIVEMVTITPIPRTNHVIEGVINYQGVTIPAVNLRRHLGLPMVSFGLDTHIIIAQIGERMIGLVVDRVLDVSEFPSVRVSRPDDILPQGLGRVPLLRGVAQTPQGIVLVLDLENLLAPGQAEAFIRVADALFQEEQEAEEDEHAEESAALLSATEVDREDDQEDQSTQVEKAEMEVKV